MSVPIVFRCTKTRMVKRKMELFFETYLIIALLFTFLIVCIAGLFLKNKKYTIGFSTLVIVLGAVLPYILIFFQRAGGSLNKEGEIKITQLGPDAINSMTAEELNEIRGPFIDYPPYYFYKVTFDYFTHNLGFIILSIAIGITLGILVHLLLKKQKSIA
jgi:hypothetical protein